MPALHPDAQRLVTMIRESGRPPYETLPAQEARKMMLAGKPVLQPDPPEVAEVRATTAPGPLGDIPLRLYRPAGTAADAVLPGLVFFHGGGWVMGDLDTHDNLARRLANEGGCRVVSVDYRMAPEHRFPAAVDDSVAAYQWARREAATLGIDPARIAVGGDSAGGNLAAVIALMARDGTLPAPHFQLLLYPVVDLAAEAESYGRLMSGLPLTTPTMRWFIDHYVPDRAQRADWRASPMRAASLAGVAPAFVLTCGHDPLVDEGRAYAMRLEREGVHVSALHLVDQPHGFLNMGRVIRAADYAAEAAGAALRDAFRQG